MLRFIIPLILILLPIIIIASVWISWVLTSIILDWILISLSIRIVSPNTVKVVETLWRFDRVLRPWFHFIIPLIEWTKNQELFRKNFSVEVEWITSDNVTWFIWLNVIYYVNDSWDSSKEWSIYKSIYSIDDPRTMIKSTIDEQLRWMMVSFNHKEIFHKREEIWEAIEARLRQKLASFGFTLDSIQVRDVKLDSHVMNAMNKVVEEEKLKEAAYAAAEAKKIMMVKEAEAEKESKILLWQWMAGQRMEIAKGFKESVDMIKATDGSLNWDKVLQFLLDSSRIETLWSIWSSNQSKLIYLNENLEWKRSSSREEKLIAWSDIMNG